MSKTTQGNIINGYPIYRFNGSTNEFEPAGYAEVRDKEHFTDKNFLKLFMDGVHKTGILEMDLFFWFVRNMSNRNVILYKNDESLALKFDVNRKTIERVKKDLRKGGLIKYLSGGIVIVNPEVIWKGKPNERTIYIKSYKEIES